MSDHDTMNKKTEGTSLGLPMAPPSLPFHASRTTIIVNSRRVDASNKHQNPHLKNIQREQHEGTEAAWSALGALGHRSVLNLFLKHPYSPEDVFVPGPSTVAPAANSPTVYSNGATILAANHLSHADPIAVIAAARRTTHYLAKDGHFSNPMTRFVMHATGQIETHREAGGSDALAGAANILINGKALGIFPEGTRSKRKEAPFLLPGKTGVARLAAAHPHAVVVRRLVGVAMMGPQHHNGLAFIAALTPTLAKGCRGQRQFRRRTHACLAQLGTGGPRSPPELARMY